MTQNITSYYIPQNLNITKGKIYCLYLNKVTNLDLTSIIQPSNLTLNGILQPNKQVVPTEQNIEKSPKTPSPQLTSEDYNKLLLILETSTKLYNQSQELVKKLSQGRKK